jgi:hypothetical protein
VGQLEVLVGELVAVDGLSTGSVVVGEVTSLEHELGCKLSKNKVTESAPMLDQEYQSMSHSRMTRWKLDPAYPNPFSPVQRARKLAAVLGTTSSNNSKVILPAGAPLMAISKKTLLLTQHLVK